MLPRTPLCISKRKSLMAAAHRLALTCTARILILQSRSPGCRLSISLFHDAKATRSFICLVVQHYNAWVGISSVGIYGVLGEGAATWAIPFGGRTSGQPEVHTDMVQSSPPQPRWQKQRPLKQSPRPLQSFSSGVAHVRSPGVPHINSSGGQ